jgi:hypothetical protein
MSEPTTDYYGLQVAAALDGDNVALQVAVDAAAFATVMRPEAPPLARLLASAAGGLISEREAELLIKHDTEFDLKQAVVDLSQTQAGDVSIGAVAGRDVVTINVYVGEVAR